MGPAMDVAEPAGVKRLDLVPGSPEPLVAFGDAMARYEYPNRLPSGVCLVTL